MEFGPQSAVESDPWGAVIRFTRWVFRSSGNRGIINMPFDLENQSYVSDKNLRPSRMRKKSPYWSRYWA